MIKYLKCILMAVATISCLVAAADDIIDADTILSAKASQESKALSQQPLIPTILCGGAGARLWPVSREYNPKPFIRLSDGQSFLQKAFLRGATLPNVADVVTVTNREFLFRVKDDYAEVSGAANPVQQHYILEPFANNTAPAIAAACLYAFQHISSDAILLVLAADHLITNQKAFSDAVLTATKLAKDNKIVTFGITPSIPETGYGYIEFKDTDVLRFVEKPNRTTAEEYLKSGRFLWNSGMFCFRAKKMLSEMANYCPEILSTTKIAIEKPIAIKDGWRQLDIPIDSFRLVPSDSIDYAVMEKTKDASVVACDIGWSDIGCWRSLGDLTPADSNGNRISGNTIFTNTTNCTVWAKDRVVGCVGLDNLVIVDTPDALLVANKGSAQGVKDIYTELKKRGHEASKVHATAHRPWGTYTILNEGEGFKVKRIEVKSGGRLSLQMHHHRSEHWVIASGIAKVLNGDTEFELSTGGSTFIPATHKHRLENVGSTMLVLIETQIGSYLGEDDIVRFDDIYGRI